jgi:hypothetical protein
MSQSYHSARGHDLDYSERQIVIQSDIHDVALTAWAVRNNREWAFEDAPAQELVQAGDTEGCILMGLF